MNAEEVAWLLVRAAEAQDFFSKLLKDPKGAAKDLGLRMEDNEVATILKYVRAMRARAEGGMEIMTFPLPKITGDPDSVRQKRSKGK